MSQSAPFYSELLLFAEQLKKQDCKPRILQMEIDGLMYTSSKLPASIGLELWPRVMALFGSAMTKAIATGETEDVGAQALLSVLDRVVDDGLLPLIRDLMQRIQCNKLYTTQQPGSVLSDFDEHFAGEYMHMMKVAAFALMHNLKGPTLGVR